MRRREGRALSTLVAPHQLQRRGHSILRNANNICSHHVQITCQSPDSSDMLTTIATPFFVIRYIPPLDSLQPELFQSEFHLAQATVFSRVLPRSLQPHSVSSLNPSSNLPQLRIPIYRVDRHGNLLSATHRDGRPCCGSRSHRYSGLSSRRDQDRYYDRAADFYAEGHRLSRAAEDAYERSRTSSKRFHTGTREVWMKMQLTMIHRMCTTETGPAEALQVEGMVPRTIITMVLRGMDMGMM